MPYVSNQDDYIKETLTPDPDGIQVNFYTSEEYEPGTVSVWVNGLKVVKYWDNGFTETGPTQITFNAAPLSGDSIQAQYDPKS